MNGKGRDLTTIVESVARSEYERNRSSVGPEHPMHDTPWESLNTFVQHSWREEVLSIVTATIRAIDEGDAP